MTRKDVFLLLPISGDACERPKPHVLPVKIQNLFASEEQDVGGRLYAVDVVTVLSCTPKP